MIVLFSQLGNNIGERIKRLPRSEFREPTIAVHQFIPPSIGVSIHKTTIAEFAEQLSNNGLSIIRDRHASKIKIDKMNKSISYCYDFKI